MLPLKHGPTESVPEIVIEKLWQLMDYQPFHDSVGASLTKAIKMLREINILVPELIAGSINKIVHSTHYDEKEKSFKAGSLPSGRSR